MLRIKGLTKKFRKKEVLHGINLELGKGVYGLLGENGAGKSTLMRTILGLYSEYSGEIMFDGDSLTNDQIGYLPQYFNGLEELKVKELLKYFADIKKISSKRVDEEIERTLKMVNLIERKNSKVKNLSGGMKQRVGIAQTLLGNPEILIYDEPTVGLDPKERIRFGNIIEEEKNNKIILISTHIVSDIECLCDKIIIMKEGHILGVYTPVELAMQAEGHVYEMTEENYNKIKNQSILVRKYLDEKEFRIRVISENMGLSGHVAPTVEDGYLWISR
ncbi:MAG: ATP-binding cassette domain-containing protein [Lachnospiraceae bacterium]|nr:ATP-binding cassette domain-containing protein [Lachnospiraceae bacterium]